MVGILVTVGRTNIRITANVVFSSLGAAVQAGTYSSVLTHEGK